MWAHIKILHPQIQSDLIGIFSIGTIDRQESKKLIQKVRLAPQGKETN